MTNYNSLTYFTGKPCPQGHYSERYSSNSVCLECHKERKPLATGKKGGKYYHPNRVAAIASGELKFSTGEPCKRGHLTDRLTANGNCIECASLNKIQGKTKNYEYRIGQKYKLTLKEYNDLVWKQNNKCAICKKAETVLNVNGEIKKLSVDHCHETKKIRGLLCSTCNFGIGYLKNNPDLLRAAAVYCEEA
jgi:hypothetical protein